MEKLINNKSRVAISGEVYTPAGIVKKMLDMIPADQYVGTRFLEPACGDGNFLVEILRRKLDALAAPNPEQILDALATVYGVDILEDNAVESRRRLVELAMSYAGTQTGPTLEKAAIGITQYNILWGNTLTGLRNDGSKLDYVQWIAATIYDRVDHRDLAQTGFFHAIVGNPPYQERDAGGGGARAIYYHFMTQAFDAAPRYVSMIVPSRWCTGGKGKGLDKFRQDMMADRRLAKIVDYPLGAEVFTGVDVAGGVMYFLWDRDYDGPCNYLNIMNGLPTGPAVNRYLDQFSLVVRLNAAVSVLEKVRTVHTGLYQDATCQGNYFNLETTTPVREGGDVPVLLSRGRTTTLSSETLRPTALEGLPKWKVLAPCIRDFGFNNRSYKGCFVAAPGVAWTESYIVLAFYDTEEQAAAHVAYLNTRFARFLGQLAKAGVQANRSSFVYIPQLDFSRSKTYDDATLYKMYGLDATEIATIESIMAA